MFFSFEYDFELSFIIYETLPGCIHLPGSVGLGHLGEITLRER